MKNVLDLNNNCFGFCKRQINQYVKLILAMLFYVLFSCQSENIEDNHLSTKELDFIAKKYNVSITNSTNISKSLFLENKEELYKTLNLLREVSQSPKYINLSGEAISNKMIIKNNKMLDSIFQKEKIKSNKINKIYSKLSSDPPYQNTYTFYFDNNFPCANVYITINYNYNSQGQITGMEVLSGQWGTSFGGTYTQNNVVLYFNGSTFGFELTGHLSTAITIGGYGLTNNNVVTYTGVLQIKPSGSSGSSNFNGRYELGTGWVRQEPVNSYPIE